MPSTVEFGPAAIGLLVITCVVAAHALLKWWVRKSWRANAAPRRLLPLIAIMLGAPALALSPRLALIVRHVTSVGLIVTVAALLVQAVNLATAVVRRRYRIDVSDNLRARAIHTQVVMVRRIAHSIIVVFAAASILMVFDSVRHFGASILASAGIASVVIGLAAQRSIATLMAGVQVAMAQPIRVDDVVIVEGEFGRVEEITLTYVVDAGRLWDLRCHLREGLVTFLQSRYPDSLPRWRAVVFTQPAGSTSGDGPQARS